MSIRPISPALQKKAEEEINEVPGRVQEDLQHIKEWIAQQPHLRARTDDQWLLAFLRGCKFSLQKTKEKLDVYHTMKGLLPEFYANRDPFLPEIQEVLKQKVYIVLPNTITPDGPMILLIRVRDTDAGKVSYLTVAKVSIMLAEVLMLENDNATIAGQQVIMDLQGLSYSNVTQITPSVMKKVMACYLQAYPTRPQGVHFINIPTIFESIYNLFKVLLNKKLFSRLKLYADNDLDTLYKTIPLSVLPKEYGGEGASIEDISAEWKSKLESYRDWFLKDAEYYSDESRRPGKPKTSADMFGMEGSFRKLEVD